MACNDEKQKNNAHSSPLVIIIAKLFRVLVAPPLTSYLLSLDTIETIKPALLWQLAVYLCQTLLLTNRNALFDGYLLRTTRACILAIHTLVNR